MPDIYDQYNDIHQALSSSQREARWVKAAELLCAMLGIDAPITSASEAKEAVSAHFYSLLNDDAFFEAAVMTWGLAKFNPRPACVSRIYEALKENNRVMIQGAAGCSKSYFCTIFVLLDWARDPEYTAVRLASMSETHLKQNLFSHLLEMWRTSAIKLPGNNDASLFLGLDSASGNSCIRGLAFPKDDRITGRFLGFKPYPRPEHPKFGKMSRVRVFLDEFNKMSPGVMGDLNSVEAAIDGVEMVKIIAAYNPAFTDHKAYEVAEPEKGWNTVNAEQDFEWKTKWGWNLIRLDGLQSENVIARKTIYPGFLTWQAFNGYLSKGDTSSDYWTFGRGWFPMQGTYNTIFSRDSLQKCKKQPIFVGDVVECAAVDTAMLVDGTIYAKGRYGPAMGYVDENGERVMFPSRRHLLYLEQLIKIPGQRDEWDLAATIKEISSQLGVSPQWLAVDKSGSGEAIYNALRRTFGDILGIMWGNKATEVKMISDDFEAPAEYYAHVASEMWFTTKKWIERGIMYISPAVPESPLFDQLTSRRRRDNKTNAGKTQVESKHEYKSRGHTSPDEADATHMLPFLIRMRHPVLPGSYDSTAPQAKQPLSIWQQMDGAARKQAEAINHVDEQDNLEEIGENGLPKAEDESRENEVEGAVSW